MRRTRVEVAVGTVVEASTQELERPRVKQSGRHETKFHAQQAISLLAPISKEMSSELNINTIVAQGAGGNLTCACWILQLKLPRAGRETIFVRGRSWRSPQ